MKPRKGTRSTVMGRSPSSPLNSRSSVRSLRMLKRVIACWTSCVILGSRSAPSVYKRLLRSVSTYQPQFRTLDTAHSRTEANNTLVRQSTAAISSATTPPESLGTPMELNNTDNEPCPKQSGRVPALVTSGPWLCCRCCDSDDNPRHLSSLYRNHREMGNLHNSPVDRIQHTLPPET